MSEEFQDRLEENEEEIREELELEEEDSKFIWDNITEFCEESDKEVLLENDEVEVKLRSDKDKEDESEITKKQKKSDTEKANDIVCKMSDEEFNNMVKKVIRKVFAKLKYVPIKKRKRKSKKKKNADSDEEGTVVEIVA